MSNTGGVPKVIITDDVHGTSADERQADASSTSYRNKRSLDRAAERKKPVASKRRACLKVDDDDDNEESTAAAASSSTAAATTAAPAQDNDESKKPAAVSAAQKDDHKTGGATAAAAAAAIGNVDNDNDIDEEMVDFEQMQYTFPERLFSLLQAGSVESAMRWLPPRGEAFCVVPKVFYDVVLLCHFQGTKFESFTRKLNRWGFKRLTGKSVPQDCVAYHHPLFKKDKPDLLKMMRSGRNKYFVPAEVGGIAARDVAAQQQQQAALVGGGATKNSPLFDFAAAFKMGAAATAVASAVPSAESLSNSARDRLAAHLSLQDNDGERNQRSMLDELLRYQALQSSPQLLLPGSLAGFGASSQTCTPLHRDDGAGLSLRQLLASQQEQQEQQMKQDNENLRKLLVAQQQQQQLEQQNAAASQRSRDNEISLRQLLAVQQQQAQQQQEQQNAASSQRSRDHESLLGQLLAAQQQQRENAASSQRNSGFTNLGAQQFLSSHRSTANDADLRLRQLLSQAGVSASVQSNTQDLLSAFAHRQGSSRGGGSSSSDAAAASSAGIVANNTPTDSQLLQLLFLQEQLERNRGGGGP